MEAVEQILRRINKIEGVRGTILVGEDGFVILSEMAVDADPSTLGPLAVSVVQAARHALSRLSLGTFHRFVLYGREGAAVIHPLGNAILLTLARKDANMGLLLVELKEASQTLSASL